MVRGNHRVELAAHGADKDSVSRKRSGQSGPARSWRKKLLVFISESAAVAGVRVERTESNARLGDSEPLSQALACNASDISYGFDRQLLRYVAQWKMRRSKHHAQLVRSEHHRHLRASQLRQHLGVTGKIVAARQQRRFIYRSSDDSV